MTLDKTTVNATTVSGSKILTVEEGEKISIAIDGVDDADMVYTVPAGKTLSIRVDMQGNEE